MQYGFRYRLESGYSVTAEYRTRGSNGDAFYVVASAATFMWTKDPHTPQLTPVKVIITFRTCPQKPNFILECQSGGGYFVNILNFSAPC